MNERLALRVSGAPNVAGNAQAFDFKSGERRIDLLAGFDQAWTDAFDLSNIAFSAASNSTTTIFSTPLAPISAGTPT